MEIPSILFDPIVTIPGFTIYIVFLVWLSRALDLFMLWVTGIGVLLFGSVVVYALISLNDKMPFSPPI
jgi:hypothetical protein